MFWHLLDFGGASWRDILHINYSYINHSRWPVGGLVNRPQPGPGLFQSGLRSSWLEFLQVGGVLAVEVSLPIVILVEVWRFFLLLQEEVLVNHSLLCKAFHCFSFVAANGC